MDRLPASGSDDDADDEEEDDEEELPTGERRPALAIGRRRRARDIRESTHGTTTEETT
jgi:hypothetical protein